MVPVAVAEVPEREAEEAEAAPTDPLRMSAGTFLAGAAGTEVVQVVESEVPEDMRGLNGHRLDLMSPVTGAAAPDLSDDGLPEPGPLLPGPMTHGVEDALGLGFPCSGPSLRSSPDIAGPIPCSAVEPAT